MICPLLRIGHYVNFKHLKGEFSACLEKDCAWRDNESKVCAMYLIASCLSSLSQSLDNMAKTLPYKATL